jgi:hypothetical protein
LGPSELGEEAEISLQSYQEFVAALAKFAR